MSHTYKDESGIIFHHNPDMSGGVTIVVPDDLEGDMKDLDIGELTIPAKSLVRFIVHTSLRDKDAAKRLTDLIEWHYGMDKAIAEYRRNRTRV